MQQYVADTHALFWYLTGSAKLGKAAKDAFDAGAAKRATIHIPAIVLAELYFLNDKAGRPLDFEAEIKRLRTAGQFRLMPFLPDDVLDFNRDSAVEEMHDRMIVGAARRLGATCLSRDARIVIAGLVPISWD